jgi:hypothetical protein
MTQTLKHDNKPYEIEYSILTTNKAQASIRYTINPYPCNLFGYDLNLSGKLYSDDGYVSLILSHSSEKKINVVGAFKIMRASSTDNYEVWYNLTNFTLNCFTPFTKEVFKDFTIEQGVSYKYSIQQINANGVATSRIETEIIHSDFEDMFLYDG